MTPIEFKYDFLLKKDRVQSLTSHHFNDAEIDWLLNEAQLSLVKRRLTRNSNRNTSYEEETKRITDISNLHIKPPLQPPILPVTDNGILEVDLSKLEYPYLYYLRATAKLANCDKHVALKFTQTDDLSEVLKDPFNRGSNDSVPFNFGRSTTQLVNGAVNSSLYIYPGDTKLDTVNVEYIKTPQKIHQGTYKYIDGSTQPQSTTDLNESVHNEIVDEAVLIASIILASPTTEFAKLKTLINE